jgi:hypothetical protein
MPCPVLARLCTFALTRSSLLRPDGRCCVCNANDNAHSCSNGKSRLIVTVTSPVFGRAEVSYIWCSRKRSTAKFEVESEEKALTFFVPRYLTHQSASPELLLVLVPSFC